MLDPSKSGKVLKIQESAREYELKYRTQGILDRNAVFAKLLKIIKTLSPQELQKLMEKSELRQLIFQTSLENEWLHTLSPEYFREVPYLRLLEYEFQGHTPKSWPVYPYGSMSNEQLIFLLRNPCQRVNVLSDLINILSKENAELSQFQKLLFFKQVNPSAYDGLNSPPSWRNTLDQNTITSLQDQLLSSLEKGQLRLTHPNNPNSDLNFVQYGEALPDGTRLTWGEGNACAFRAMLAQLILPSHEVRTLMTNHFRRFLNLDTQSLSWTQRQIGMVRSLLLDLQDYRNSFAERTLERTYIDGILTRNNLLDAFQSGQVEELIATLRTERVGNVNIRNLIMSYLDMIATRESFEGDHLFDAATFLGLQFHVRSRNLLGEPTEQAYGNGDLVVEMQHTNYLGDEHGNLNHFNFRGTGSLETQQQTIAQRIEDSIQQERVLQMAPQIENPIKLPQRGRIQKTRQEKIERKSQHQQTVDTQEQEIEMVFNSGKRKPSDNSEVNKAEKEENKRKKRKLLSPTVQSQNGGNTNPNPVFHMPQPQKDWKHLQRIFQSIFSKYLLLPKE